MAKKQEHPEKATDEVVGGITKVDAVSEVPEDDAQEQESVNVVVEEACGGGKDSKLTKRDEELAELRKRAEDFEVEIKKLRAEKAEAEWITKSSGISFSDKNYLGVLLNKVASFDANVADDILSIMKSAEARISEGNLFSEIGKSSDAKISAYDRLNKIADEIRKSQNITQAKAFSIACEQNHELVAEYRQSK